MTIKPFLSIISKDLKIFFRNTPSALTILIAPLLIILLAGLSFNSSALSGLTISTHSDSYTNLTEEILADFTSQGYFIDKSASQEDCIDSVKLTNSQICIIFPSDLSTQGSEAEVIFHIDYSRINLAYTLIHEVENKISIQAKDLGTLLAQDLINSLNQIKKTLPENKELKTNN